MANEHIVHTTILTTSAVPLSVSEWVNFNGPQSSERRQREQSKLNKERESFALDGIGAWDIEPFRLPLSMWMEHEFVLKLLFAEKKEKTEPWMRMGERAK